MSETQRAQAVQQRAETMRRTREVYADLLHGGSTREQAFQTMLQRYMNRGMTRESGAALLRANLGIRAADRSGTEENAGTFDEPEDSEDDDEDEDEGDEVRPTQRRS